MGIFWPAPGPSNAEFASLQDGLAIVADGNTHIAITSGQYVYVKNHDTLSDGLYKASSNIAANATLSGSNLTADSKGGLNDIAEQIDGMTIVIFNRSKTAKQLLEEKWMTAVPNGGEGKIYFISIQAQGGTLFGYISRYSDKYGVCSVNHYGGTAVNFYLNNGVVTEKLVTQTNA